MEFEGKGFQFPRILVFDSYLKEGKGILNELFFLQMKENSFLHHLNGINSFITWKVADYDFALTKHASSGNLSYSSHSRAADNLSYALRLLHFITAIVKRVDMLDGMIVVRYKKVKDELILDGNDNELKRVMKNKDIQKFLDGNYVSNKGKIEFCYN
uniref:Uncharacterized protein n=1 Tax=Lactuca sativa TaxID=4236 RepID=A0A9R1VYB9_LACSA|nr:hypothetical protein LSAT_V11C300135390 [Lactuca sativa]